MSQINIRELLVNKKLLKTGNDYESNLKRHFKVV